MELESQIKHVDTHVTYEYLNLGETAALKVAQEALQYKLFNKAPVPFPEPQRPEFTFIDLFAGIGGFRVAMQSLGGKCVFTSELDEKAQLIYKAEICHQNGY